MTCNCKTLCQDTGHGDCRYMTAPQERKMSRECERHGPWPRYESMCVQCATDATPNEDITCPFCGRQDFDKIGLKHHLNRCEAMDEIAPLPHIDF